MTRTRVPVSAPRGFTDVGDVGQMPDVDMTRQGAHQDQLDVTPAFSPKDIETAAFFEQRVTIHVHESAEEGAIDTLVLNVNGEDCVIPRGRSIEVKRKFVQQLLDMRETKFKQPARNAMNVESGNRLTPKTQLLYPFSVESDPHRYGMAWLANEQRRAFSFSLR